MLFIRLLRPRQQQHNTHYEYMENTQSLGLQDSEQWSYNTTQTHISDMLVTHIVVTLSAKHRRPRYITSSLVMEPPGCRRREGWRRRRGEH